MSDLEIVARVAEVARRAREPGASRDPTFFDLKAEVFEAIAVFASPFGPKPEEARRLAETARARALEIRTEQTCTLCLDGQHERCGGAPCKCEGCVRVDITPEGRAALARIGAA